MAKFSCTFEGVVSRSVVVANYIWNIDRFVESSRDQLRKMQLQSLWLDL